MREGGREREGEGGRGREGEGGSCMYVCMWGFAFLDEVGGWRVGGWEDWDVGCGMWGGMWEVGSGQEEVGCGRVYFCCARGDDGDGVAVGRGLDLDVGLISEGSLGLGR